MQHGAQPDATISPGELRRLKRKRTLAYVRASSEGESGHPLAPAAKRTRFHDNEEDGDRKKNKKRKRLKAPLGMRPILEEADSVVHKLSRQEATGQMEHPDEAFERPPEDMWAEAAGDDGDVDSDAGDGDSDAGGGDGGGVEGGTWPFGIPGEILLRRIQITLGLFHRSDDQVRFHDYFLRAIARTVYGPRQFYRCLHRILESFRWDKIQRGTNVRCARRWGKTTSIAQFEAALLYNVPGIRSIAFSTGKRASKSLLHLTRDKLHELPDGVDIIVRCNEETLMVRCRYAPSGAEVYMGTFSAFPSKESTLRGQGGHVIILEEAAFIDDNVFFRVVLPLLGVEQTALISITTPNGDNTNNGFEILCRLRDPRTGESLFHVVSVEMYCPICAGRTIDAAVDDCLGPPAPGEQAPGNSDALCIHLQMRLPGWKDASGDDISQQVFAAAGREGDYQRESRGVDAKDTQLVFPERVLETFRRFGADTAEAAAPECIVTTFDPNLGGPSESALVSTYHVNGKIFVAALDAFNTNEIEIGLLAEAHFDALRRHPRFGGVPILFVPEKNLPTSAADAINVAQRRHSQGKQVFCFLNNGDTGTGLPSRATASGIRTMTGSKELYTRAGIAYLHSGNVLFASDMTSGNYKGVSGSHTALMRDKLIQQLGQWRCIRYQTARTQRSSIVYSGKVNAEGKIQSTLNDDLAITFLINLLVIQELYQRRLELMPIDYQRLLRNSYHQD